MHGTCGEGDGCDNTNGWRFQALNDISVTFLGVWDEGADGLPARVDVGIWNDTGTLLGDLTLGSGSSSTLLNGFRYEALGTPVLLNAGQFYRVGSSAVSGRVQWREDVTFTNAPDIAFDAGYYAGSINALTFPSIRTNDPNAPDIFGANFQYVAVPEASAFLLGGVIVAVGGVNRRRAELTCDAQRSQLAAGTESPGPATAGALFVSSPDRGYACEHCIL